MDDFWQQVANFVFNVSNVLFLSIYATDSNGEAVVTLKIYNPRLDRLCATNFLTLLHPYVGIDLYFGNHWARSTYQPLW